jgi:hypothetical protein
VLTEILEARRYAVPDAQRRHRNTPVVEVTLVDMRERELLLKGQEILTSDKVAVRVSIITQYRVLDPAAAVEKGVTTTGGPGRRSSGQPWSSSCLRRDRVVRMPSRLASARLFATRPVKIRPMRWAPRLRRSAQCSVSSVPSGTAASR